MAKGLRSSKNKNNNVKLRAKVFGPVEDARKERLSAKLLELASKPRIPTDSDMKMAEDGALGEEAQSKAEVTAQSTNKVEDMDIDEEAGVRPKQNPKKSGRVQKRAKHKAQSTMVFPVYKKGRRVGPRTKPRK